MRRDRFLVSLRALVEQCPTEIGAWSDDGKAFCVRDGAAFKRLLAQDFYTPDETRALRCFTRQLQLRRFTKTRAGDGPWSFSHPGFLRDSKSGGDAGVKRFERAPVKKG